MNTFVDLHIEDEHIAVVTLQRPNAANALSKALLEQFQEIIDQIDQNPTIYCTVITGSTEKVFCAGADLKERREMNDAEVIQAVGLIGTTIDKVDKMKMPVIAAINGVAYGGGLELALACDFRIAVSDTKLGLTETSLAIIPGAGGTQRLTRLIGLGQAKRLIFTAQPITTEEALQIGLVEKVVHRGDLMTTTLEIARIISRNGPIALLQAKRAINQGIQTDLKAGLAIEKACYQQTIHTEDRIEGLQAFKEKRLAIYKGK